MEQGQHDWSWLGPVAGAVGVGLGAAGAVIAGAWKFLGKFSSGGGPDREVLRVLENRLTVLETEASMERDLAARDRRETLAMFEKIFEKSDETNSKVERALALLERRK